MPRQLMKIQAFLELPRHFQKCQISSNACDIYIYVAGICGNLAFPEMPRQFWKCLGFPQLPRHLQKMFFLTMFNFWEMAQY